VFERWLAEARLAKPDAAREFTTSGAPKLVVACANALLGSGRVALRSGDRELARADLVRADAILGLLGEQERERYSVKLAELAAEREELAAGLR